MAIYNRTKAHRPALWTNLLDLPLLIAIPFILLWFAVQPARKL